MAGETLICPKCHSLYEAGCVTCEHCGVLLAERPLGGPALARGTMVAGQYRLDFEIGRGAMGIVYRAVDVLVGQQVALKVIRPELAANERFRKRLLNEVRTARTINHPNVVRVHGLQFWEGMLFMSMEYLEGEDLHRRLLRAGPLPEADARQVLERACEGLEVAHERQIIHRDINAKNLFLTGSGVKILDFGVARDLDLTEFTGSRVFGTPAYMAPELLRPEGERQEEADCQTDIWSLGVTTYQMLSGQLPYRADDLARFVALLLTREARPIKELNASISEEMAAIVDRMLARDRRLRYQGVSEIIHDLKDWGDKPRRQRATVRWLPKPGPLAKRAALAALLLVALLVGYRLFQRPEPVRVDPAISLAEAEAYMKLGLYAPPSPKNAFARISSVLTAFPNHPGATALLGQLRREVAGRCKEAVGAGDVESGLAFYHQLEIIAPEQAVLVEAAAKIRRLQQKLRERRYARRLASELVNEGDGFFAKGAIFRPPGGNAIDRYRQALRLDPGYSQARNKLKGIRARLVSEARVALNAAEAYRARDVLAAAALVKDGEDIQELAAQASRMIRAERERRETQPAIARAVARGREHVEAGRYVLPPGDNAYENLAEALALDPQDSEARGLLARVHEALMAEAESALEKGDLQQARFQFQNALTVEKTLPAASRPAASAEPGLATVIARIEEEEARKIKAREVSRLLAQARDYQRLGQWLGPPEGGASGALRRAEEIAPGDERVGAEIDRVKLVLSSQADAAVRDGSLARADRVYSILREIDPGDEAVARRQDELRSRLAAAKKRRVKEKSVEKLIARADSAFNRGLHWSPEENGALTLYQSALKLDPANARAAERVRAIKANYVNLANTQAAARDLQGALGSLRVAARADPDDTGLRRRIESIADKVAGALRKREEVEAKLATLRKREEREPGLALEGYLEVVETESSNGLALAALQRLRLAYAMRADKAAAAGDYDRSLELLKQARRADPSDESLARREAEIARLKEETMNASRTTRIFRPLTSF